MTAQEIADTLAAEDVETVLDAALLLLDKDPEAMTKVMAWVGRMGGMGAIGNAGAPSFAIDPPATTALGFTPFAGGAQ